MTTWLGVPVSADQMSPMSALPKGDYLGLKVPEVALPTLPQTPTEQAPQTVKPFYNPATKQYAINGRIIEEDDAQGLLEAEALIGTPATAGRPGNGWFNLGEDRFRAITDKIKNPSLTTRFTKNFGRGVDSAQLLAGAGLQFIGAETLGRSIVDQQIEDLRRTTPYEKQFTDIQNVNDATGWFVGMVGQGLPSLIESAVATLVGAGVGTATATPGAGTLGGAVAGLLGKGALKQQIVAAARKRAAGEALDAAEQQALRRGGQLAGATLANALNSYRTGVSDVYSEARELGADSGDMGARGAAALGGIPYAALDFATDALLAGRLFGDALSPRAYPGGFVRNTAEVGRRGAVGATVGGFTEGLAEMGQEAVVMASTGQPLNTPEAIDRLTNAFAAGWAVGSTVGGGANVLAPGKPRNLMTGETENLDGTPALGGPQIAGLLPPPPAPGTDLVSDPRLLPAPEGVAGYLPGSDTIYGEAPQAPLALTDQRPPVGTQAELFPDLPVGTPTSEIGIPTPGAAPVADTGEVQDVLPFDAGLAPFRTEQAPQQEAEGALADNPILRALRASLQQQQQQTNPVLSAQRQAEFERAQAARGQVPPLSPRDRLLAESRQFELAAQSALPEPEFGATPEMAASMWDQLRPKGRPKAFANNLPGVQNQWIDALNMYLAGELDVDSLRQIRRELASAESAARLTRSEPRTVVTGAITPAPSPEPTPPKPSKSKSLKKGKTDASPKPKAAALAKGKQAGSGSTAGERDTAADAGRSSGERAAPAAASRAEEAPAPVQDEPRAADAAQQEGAVRESAEKLTPAEERGNLPTATARLDAAIEFVEEATTKTSGRDVADAYYELLDVAFFDPTPSDDGKTRRAMQEKARKFLSAVTSTWHRPHLTSAFRQQVLEAETLDAKKEWFQFMLDKDLASSFPKKARAKVKNLDVDATPEAEPLVETKRTTVAADPTPAPKAIPASESMGFLTALLQRMLTMKGMTRASWDSPATLQKLLADSTAMIGYKPFSDDIGIAAAAEDLYAELTDTDRSEMVKGRPVTSYFTSDGELRLDVVSTFETGGQTFEMLAIAPDPAADSGRYSLADMVPDKPSAIGSVRLKVKQFVAKLARKPKVHVYRDQADLKAQNPALYREAKRARPEGDFDTKPAAGYAFGDGKVIIFSDRIANTQHLNFVMAHEVMGHFGLRGIIPADQFSATMEAIYQASPAIQAQVDAMVETRGMPRAEATEEVLADMAGQLDNSIIARVWSAIKSALNKLGVKFGDEFPRYFLSRARAYVRTGQGGMFDPAQVFGGMYQMDYVGTPISTGRFSVADDLYGANRFAAEAARQRAGFREIDLGEIGRQFKGTGRNVQDFYDRFKSSFLSLANYRARDNYGMNMLVGIINEGIKLTSGIRVRSNERNAAILNADDDTKKRTSKLLYAAQEKAATAFGDGSKFKRGPALFNYTGGKWVANDAEIARLRDMGRVTLAQARDGFDYDLLLPTGTVKKMRFPGIPGLTKDSPEWKGYESMRDTIDEIALKLLQADYIASSEVQNSAFSEFAAYVDGPLTNADREMFRKIVNQYVNLKNGDLGYDADGNPVLNINAMKRAEELLEFMNKSIISKGKEADVTKFADILGEQMADDVLPQFRSFIKRAKVGGSNKFAIQDKIRQLGGVSSAARAADFGAKRTLATGYTPLHREGRYQIRTTVVDSQGKPMQVVDAYQSQLVYMRVADEKDAVETTRRLNEAFGNTEYEVEVFDPNTGEYVKRKGRLVAQAEVASDGVAGPLYLDYAEFLYGIEQLGIRITPEEMERAIKALTEQSSGVRKRGLNRDFVPGAEEDAIKASSIYTDRMASAIGKKVMRPQLSQIMNRNMASTRAMWNSDPTLPDGRTVRSVLKERLKNGNLTAAERADTQRELDRLEFMYRKTNPEGRPARGNQYYNEAQRTVGMLEGNRDVMESDFEGGKIASQARAYTSLFQLGGSIATGALNLITLFTNTMPYLMTYNAKNGFGGGFGAGQVVAEMHTAMMQVGVKGWRSEWNTAEFYDKLAETDPEGKVNGIKDYEARFIAQEIRDGVFIPAQSNALLNTARGRTDSQLRRKIQDYWMTPFNLTEQASRRSAGLAAFRMEYARRKDAGQSDNQAFEGARQFAIETIELTMGEYSVHNRPPAFRTGWQTMLYMYKVYPVTTIQLFSNLSRTGKLGMIAALWMLSGLQGLPFAEDLEDLIDTLLQGMGFQVGSSRLVAAQVMEDMFPGVSPYLLRGVVNSFVPADIASRTSVGNLIPGTEILLSGADVGRGLMDIAGPIPAAVLGSAQFAANIVRAPFSDTISVLDTARAGPVTVLRAMGDTVAYAQTDRIIDRKGATVSDEMNELILATRIMGFYPQAAAEEYGLIRVSQRVNNYRNETTAAFRQAWVKAKLAGDTAGARQIERAVRDWNRGAKGTGLEISDFVSRSERALKEARKPARERTLRATGKDARDEIERGMDLLSY